MNPSILWEYPGLAISGVLLVLALLVALPLAAAFRRSRRDSRQPTVGRKEPRIPSVYYDDDYRDDRAPRGREDDRVPRGREDDRVQHGREDDRAPRRHDDDRGYDDEYDYDLDYDDDGRDKYANYRKELFSQPIEPFRDRYEPEPQERRKPAKPARSGGLGKSLWFVFGICVGAGGLALWNMSSMIVPAIGTLNRDQTATPATATPSPPSKNEARFASDPPASGPSSGASDAETSGMINDFVSGLRTQLPLNVGPGIDLTSVDAAGNSVTIEFSVARAFADDEIATFQEDVKAGFRKNVCATAPNPTNIHGLSQRGVSFNIFYKDMLGKGVAELTAEAGYCSATDS